MTKATVTGIDGKDAGSIELPIVFETPYRPEVIHKVYVNLASHTYQRQGRYPAAGENVSAESRNTGLGIARLARARGEGFPRAGQAAGVAGVRHGRVAHPPESWKHIYKKINHKEKQLGLCSAIAATARRDLVEGRGHKLAKDVKLPLVVSNDIESVAKAKDLINTLSALGIADDLARAGATHKVRSGTARRRGRSARIGTSALVVVGNDAKALAIKSIPGVEVKTAKEISVLDLAPGSKPIRLTIFSQNAIEQLKEVKAPMHKVMEMIR
ncbi:ribosomal protein L4 [Candidatus Nitrososphaera evergladensis SR1]|jgi:large subunit ribosomal protein L4e|uniref:Ribosomal protein L4 n=1 Tax=Candidatus Nitrososphaera evergladensis SR1 TaxID=1459636 RepID=A0A075MS13_9ARCH|nr:50S ribosomal protein L4 [Candidatus Nitrososphaera evergladensis]AIF83895.1 ribosomal protein L4 [Candidatus Nitrososphaera evergladensis SR1]